MAAKAVVAATLALVVSASAPLLELKGSGWVDPVTGMRFVLLPRGTFTMGSPSVERWREQQETPHEVTSSRRVFMSVYEVTQEQWREVMGTRPSWFDRPRCPPGDRGYSLGFRVVREPRPDTR